MYDLVGCVHGLGGRGQGFLALLFGNESWCSLGMEQKPYMFLYTSKGKNEAHQQQTIPMIQMVMGSMWISWTPGFDCWSAHSVGSRVQQFWVTKTKKKWNTTNTRSHLAAWPEVKTDEKLLWIWLRTLDKDTPTLNNLNIMVFETCCSGSELLLTSLRRPLLGWLAWAFGMLCSKSQEVGLTLTSGSPASFKWAELIWLKVIAYVVSKGHGSDVFGCQASGCPSPKNTTSSTCTLSFWGRQTCHRCRFGYASNLIISCTNAEAPVFSARQFPVASRLPMCTSWLDTMDSWRFWWMKSSA